MATVEIRIQGAPHADILTLGRVPCVGEYVASPKALFKVLATVFTPHSPKVEAVVYAIFDPAGISDDLGMMPRAPEA